METLKANVRDMTKKAKRLRREGFITGSICGRDMKESLSIQIPENDVLQFMKSHNVGCKMTLDVDGKSYVVMLKNVDYDSLTSHYINMDFQQLEADEKVKGTAEVILENEDRCAGFVTSNCTELEYEAYPKDIFDRIVIDVTKYPINTELKVRDLDVAKNKDITILTPLDTSVLHIAEHRHMKAEELAEIAAEEAEAAANGTK
ncbi:MAG: 50S ribosomal protein L25 [Lachnospiraceae bacterium]|jgi:large subunit ribosomal protein L25|nr:50S ribosomal protein L25 [Lachnospiraceae bacterium]MCH4063250.1 50S ribosomal protein L25 [Lachnospiraceae bacterium]MCH4105073.1 50S ribosomal protein L25 [Lachnospiraceae bacterium]MCI1308531.1 50S ribosomal protein L25 [Lachnospiraceae bacterium]MCI1333071.1 50S ribosomal protein L25 [Lachnospiraceae bacterium]